MSAHQIRFEINVNLFLKDPQSTAYGQKILGYSIELLDELGFEAFTFKKLARLINSTEASIYRYFQNKHLLLLYLTCWYWERVNYLIQMNIRNIKDAKERLRIVIHHIINPSSEFPLASYINEDRLHHVVINEGSKAYHIHNVDDENKKGFFQSYKEVVGVVAEIISAVSPDFPYPRLLASNLFEMANNQIYFSEHLPRLTDLHSRQEQYADLEKAIQFMTFKMLT